MGNGVRCYPTLPSLNTPVRRTKIPLTITVSFPITTILAHFTTFFTVVDLVTLDDLSAEAMVESSQRIDQMASMYKRRAEPLSDPGPPAILPPKIKRANFLVQIFGLWM